MGIRADATITGQAADGIDFLSRRLVSLRAVHWDGELPRPGHFLRTVRGRTAYEIAAVRENARPDPRSRALFRCYRIAPAAIPEGATVHEWAWSSRD